MVEKGIFNIWILELLILLFYLQLIKSNNNVKTIFECWDHQIKIKNSIASDNDHNLHDGMYHVTVDELTNENSDDQYQVLVLYTKIECKNHNWINEDGGKKVNH